MPNFRLAPLSLLLGLLAACATPPGGPAAPHQERSAPARAAIDWPRISAELVRELGALPGLAVQPLNAALAVQVPAADGFASGQSALRPELAGKLEQIAAVLRKHPQAAVEIIGHTDSIGSELFNLRLSIDRAEAVMEFLRSHGVALLRLSADGRGEAEPIADNDSAEGRARNRRVELRLRPLH